MSKHDDGCSGCSGGCDGCIALGAAQEREAVLQLIWQWLDQPGPSAEQALRKLHTKLKQGVHRPEWGGPVEGLLAFNTALLANPKFQALKAAAHAPKCRTCGGTKRVYCRDEDGDDFDVLLVSNLIWGWKNEDHNHRH